MTMVLDKKDRSNKILDNTKNSIRALSPHTSDSESSLVQSLSELGTTNPNSSVGSDDSLSFERVELTKKSKKKPVSYEFRMSAVDARITLIEIKNKIWPVWERRHALSMEVARETNTVAFKIMFENRTAATTAIKQTSLKRMATLLGELKPKEEKFARFLGPNGQKQHNVTYRPNECKFGCHQIISKENWNSHSLTCPNQAKYLDFQRKYNGSQARLVERPNTFAAYTNDAIEGNALEADGFLYGYGPFRLTQKCMGKIPK